jgi:hypothetical protein
MGRRDPSDWNDATKLHNELAPDGLDIGNRVNADRTDQSWCEMQAPERCLDEIGRRQRASLQRLSHPSFQQGEVS